MKQIIREIFVGGVTPPTVVADIGLSILRIAAGLMMALGHGIHKLPPSEDFINGVGELGFPMPIVFAWMAGLSEFLGGLLLAIGLFTRPAAFFIMGTMLTAALVAHWDDPWLGQPPSKEWALLYLSVALAFLLAGSGRISVDHFLR